MPFPKTNYHIDTLEWWYRVDAITFNWNTKPQNMYTFMYINCTAVVLFSNMKKIAQLNLRKKRKTCIDSFNLKFAYISSLHSKRRLVYFKVKPDTFFSCWEEEEEKKTHQYIINQYWENLEQFATSIASSHKKNSSGNNSDRIF